MGILNTAKDKFTGASKSVSEMSKNASETSNLKKKIAYEMERIREVMMEIGQKYYDNPDGDKTELLVLCDDIRDRKRRIESMKADFLQLKGQKTCSGCGTKYDDKYQFEFCGKCGGKLI